MKLEVSFLNCIDMSEIIEIVGKEYNTEGIVLSTYGNYEEFIKKNEGMGVCKRYVLVSSGIGTRDLQEMRNFTAPVVAIKPEVYDILKAVESARKISDNIKVIILENYVPYFNVINALLKIPIDVKTIQSYEEVDAILSNYAKEDSPIIIGSSYICHKARKLHMKTKSIWSKMAIRAAVEAAIKIMKTTEELFNSSKILTLLLNEMQKGAIFIDENDNVQHINSSAEDIFHVKKSNVQGKNVDKALFSYKIKTIKESVDENTEKVISINDTPMIFRWQRIKNIDEELLGTVLFFEYASHIQKSEALVRRNITKKRFVAEYTFNGILGDSEAIREVKRTAINYAHAQANILITGETGVGKELFAQSIHNESAFCKGPFVSVNFAALPPSLVESEIFGYEEGAFTGAKKGGKMGLFELAHGGTLFLDEIGEIPMHMQAQLLRAIEEKEVLRIGGEFLRSVDVRIIAATNVDLPQLIKRKLFREDLYYRLNTLRIMIPPLRERTGDIPLIVSLLLQKMRHDLTEGEIKKISNSKALMMHAWGGNVRELRNLLERFCVIYTKGVTVKQSLDIAFKYDTPILQNDNCKTKDEELLEHLLQKHHNNKTLVAKELGVSRTTVYRYLKEKGKEKT